MKHKVGDKVRILTRQQIEKTFYKEKENEYWFLDKYGEKKFQFYGEMFNYCGKEMIIREANQEHYYNYNLDEEYDYCWTDEFFDDTPKQLELF